jgi:predicted nucleic acid-binding protein
LAAAVKGFRSGLLLLDGALTERKEERVNAARFRAEYKLRTPDAIQVATAIASHSHALVTNDRRLRKIRGILVFVSDEAVEGAAEE